MTRSVGQIDSGELEQTAAMARLRVDPDEREELIAELERIVEYFALLAEADVDDLHPTTHPLMTDTRLREDVLAPLPTVYDSVEAGPDLDQRFIVVPNVL